MITAFLDIHTRARCDPPAAPRAVAAKRRPAAPPKPTEASTTSMHALFEPLPPEEAGPRAAEAAGRELWQGPVPGHEEPDTGAGGGDWESAFMDEEERAALMEDGDDVSEPDFEAESLEAEDDGRGAAAAEELSSSVETVDLKAVFGSRRAGKAAGGGKAVYSGPLLCCEDDDFD